MVCIGQYERLECPEEFQQLLTDIFGVNVYGEPIFRIVWGQTQTIRVSIPSESGGYEDQTVGGNLAAWLLQRWMGPEKWGMPGLFNRTNVDPANGQPLFPYPEFGQYEIMHNLGAGDLDYGIINSAIPLLQEVLYMSDAQLQAAKDREKELKEKAQVEDITDRLLDSMPTRYGPTSYGRGGCKTSILDKKMHEIQQVWNRMDVNKLRNPVKGMQQHN